MAETVDLEGLKRQVAGAAALEGQRARRRLLAGRVALLVAILGLWELLSGRVLDPFFFSTKHQVQFALVLCELHNIGFFRRDQQ